MEIDIRPFRLFEELLEIVEEGSIVTGLEVTV